MFIGNLFSNLVLNLIYYDKILNNIQLMQLNRKIKPNDVIEVIKIFKGNIFLGIKTNNRNSKKITYTQYTY